MSTKIQTLFHSLTTSKAFQNIAIGIFGAAIVLGIFSRIVPAFQDSEYSSDMARDAFVYQEMWKGNFPTLGPVSSVGMFSLPPQYYYLVWPFTVFGPQSWWPVLSSGIFSFGSIILIGILIYRLLENLPRKYRLILAAGSTFWWSILTTDIILANRAWNPSPINFFLLAFILIWDRLWHTSTKQNKKLKLWAGHGLILSMLLGMHGSTLMLMPIFYVGSMAIYFFKHKHWQGPIVSLTAAFLPMLPYFIGEIRTNWANTRLLAQTLFGESEKNSFWSLIDRAIFTFAESSKQIYFLNPWLFEFSLIFLVIVVTTSFLFFRGNRLVYYSWLSLYGIFILIAANFQGYLAYYYITVLWTMPLIFTVTAIAYFPYSRQATKVAVSAIIVIGVFFSIFANGLNSKAFLSQKYGPIRQLNTNDMVNALAEFPDKAKVCRKPDFKKNTYEYIDQYIVKKNIYWEINNTCEQSDFYLLRKYEIDYSMFDDTASPKLRTGQLYTFLYTPPRLQKMELSGWRFWKEVSGHEIYIREG